MILEIPGHPPESRPCGPDARGIRLVPEMIETLEALANVSESVLEALTSTLEADFADTLRKWKRRAEAIVAEVLGPQ